MKNSLALSKHIKKMILPLAMLLLSLALANALGVSPAFKTIYFIPNTTINLDFEIINSEGNSFEAALEGYGDIQEQIFFENQKIQISADDYNIPFRLMLKLPYEMQPGILTGGIKITPLLEPDAGQALAAYVAPQIPIKIKVPYPHKYADISALFLSVDEGTPLPIYVEFDNMGSADIDNAGAVIEIYDPRGLLLSNISAPNVSVTKKSLGKTQAQPAPLLQKGLYTAIVKAYYDGNEKIIAPNFTVGEPLIRVQELMAKNLIKNEINRVSFRVRSEWNAELSVSGFLELDGKKQEFPNFNIDKEQEKEIIGFFDTTGFADGDYVIKISLAYASQIRTESFPVSIGERVSKPVAFLTLPVIIMLSILILIIIGIIIVLLINKKKKENM